MAIRTDLALELRELHPEKIDGVRSETATMGDIKITRIYVETEDGERALGKKRGRYITIEVPPFFQGNAEDSCAHKAIENELNSLLPKKGAVLAIGLGNTDITPDALGPKTAERILATRHISARLAQEIGLPDLRPVAVLAPGVLGQTGIETAEIILGTVERIRPAAVVAIDALAARRLSRLGCTVQMSDTGISPGSGVGNARSEISEEKLGVPVVSIGIPTVVDARTLLSDLLGEEAAGPNQREEDHMIVTPREIDMLIDRASELTAHALNCALQPSVDPAVLRALV